VTAPTIPAPQAPMSPHEAIDRVVYLLDRVLAPRGKVRAFQNAGEVVGALAPGELDERIQTGRLEELAGIGKSTSAVIIEAARGEVPTYLQRLEADSVVPLSDEAGPYRAALRGDCHLHSNWSDGGAPIELMAQTARALGHEYMVLTDHSPRLTVAHGLNRDRLLAQLDVLAELNQQMAPFRILTGIEVDILEDGTLDQDEELLARLDLVVASVHSKLRMDRAEMTRRMVMAIASPHTDILGHCTGRQVSSTQIQRVMSGADGHDLGTTVEETRNQDPKRPPSAFDADIVFAACAQFDKAVEINSRPERQDPPDHLLALALEWDCKISIDTDAHAPAQLEWQNFGCEKAARHGVEIDRIINTWDVDTLLRWTRSHPSG
jgi:putative hydrolase